MANNKKTSWGSDNLVIENDYNIRFNEIVAGNPEISAEKPQTQGGSPTISVDVWYKLVTEETARWKYVGMDYTTAQSCVSTLKTALTFTTSVWDYGFYVDNGTLLYGYHVDKTAPNLESNITIVKCGDCDMYNVVVDARVKTEYYSKTAGLYSQKQTPLANYLGTLNGWNTYPSGWSNGTSQSSASEDNIVLVQAPSVTRQFEIVGSDIFGASYVDWTTYNLPVWYKCTDTYICQVKYNGLTHGACKNLFNSMNNTSGWYYSYHPYEYKYNSTYKTFNWEEDTNKTIYQCLNDFKTTKLEGNMWTAELSLCVEKYLYTKNPAYTGGFSWPSQWSSIPGLSQFL